MPFKNDPVVGGYIQKMFLSCSGVSLRDLTSLFVFPAGWQWLIDDTIKSLHLMNSGVKDNILVSSSYQKPGPSGVCLLPGAIDAG